MTAKKKWLIALRHALRLVSIYLVGKGAISAEVEAGIGAALSDPELWFGVAAAGGSMALDVKEDKTY